MSLALLATKEELKDIVNIEGARLWSGLAVETWNALNSHLGTAPNLRTLAVIPKPTFQAALVSVRVTTTSPSAGEESSRPLTPVEVTQAGLMWRVSRQKFELPDIDPLEPEASPVPVQEPPKPKEHVSASRRIKISQVLDQANDGDIPALTQAEIDSFYLNLRTVKGGPPLVDADPTPDQIAAVKARIIDHQETPWADFALFTPFNSRFLKQLKFKSFILQQDGSFKGVEVPGPASFEVWQSSWKVFANVLLGLTVTDPLSKETLPVVTPSALEEYFENFRELVSSYPEVWHLLVVAEDRCRAEHFARLRRQKIQDHKQGQAPGFNPLQPWDEIFRAAARDKVYWDKAVRDPAIAFLARSSKRSGHESAVSEADTEWAEQGLSKRARRNARQKALIENLKAQATGAHHDLQDYAAESGGGKGSGKGKGNHPRKDKQGRYVTTREGVKGRTFASLSVWASVRQCALGE